MRLCSRLVMLLLALSVASPVLAAGKKKKDAAAEESKDEAESADEAKAEEEDKPKSKKGKKGKAAEEETEESATESKGEATEGTSESAEASQEMPDPNVWERPPEDEEKPKKEAAAAAAREDAAGDGRPWMAGLVAGYGLLLDSTESEFGADPYGIGFGLRAGYTFDFQLYAGLVFHYFLGWSNEGALARTNMVGSTSASYMQIGAEVGYDAWIGDSAILRPSLQLGVALGFFSTGDSSVDASSPQGGMLVAPGIAVLFPIDQWFIGAELRPTIVAGNGANGLFVAAHGGMRFE